MPDAGMVPHRRLPDTGADMGDGGCGHGDAQGTGAAGWCLVLALPGLLDRRRLERPPASSEPVPSSRRRGRRLWRHLAVAALPLYVLHQPVVVAVAYAVIGWSAPVPVKYAALVAISFVLTFALYELLVRRIRATRFLFGMRS